MTKSLEVLRGVADQYFTELYEPIRQRPVLDRRPDAIRMAAHIGLLYAGEQSILIASRGYEFADPITEEPEIMTTENFPGSRRIQTTHEGQPIDLETVRTNLTPYSDTVALNMGNLTLAVAVPGFGVVHNVLEVVEQASREGVTLVRSLSDSQKIELGHEKFGYLEDIYRAMRIAKLYSGMVREHEPSQRQ